MKQNRGKQFEKIVKEQLVKASYYVLRLQDSMGGYAGVSNPGDFLVFYSPNLYLVECKAIRGNTFNFKTHIRENQLKGMAEAAEHKNAQGCFIVWWLDHNCVEEFSIQQVQEAIYSGVKSFSPGDKGKRHFSERKKVFVRPNFRLCRIGENNG